MSGVAEGTAKVITDPSDPKDLGPGNILIAPLTDPSWTPLFVPADAVVVNVGGQMSHACRFKRIRHALRCCRERRYENYQDGTK